MIQLTLVGDGELERLPVVANCTMNRGRGLVSYERELGVPFRKLLHDQPTLRWLDLCCGEGRALKEASRDFPDASLWGLDLVDSFRAADGVRFSVGSWRNWEPPTEFDLITCVHGFHYFGDKLSALSRISHWLTPHGQLLGHLDLKSFRDECGRALGRVMIAWLRAEGWSYDRRKVLRRFGPAPVPPWEFLGADPNAGPNFTKQPAVDSYYRRL